MSDTEPEESNLVKHTGGCHCGAVRFEILAPAIVTVWDCNCSICVMKQNRHFVVPNSRFKLLQGEDHLTCYTFNTHKAKHTFCEICGVQSFYTPRSNPDGKGISPYCIDKGTLQEIIVKVFDGQNWEQEFKARGGSDSLVSK